MPNEKKINNRSLMDSDRGFFVRYRDVGPMGMSVIFAIVCCYIRYSDHYHLILIIPFSLYYA